MYAFYKFDFVIFSFLDVVWYKNDKLVSNTQNVKVRISDEEKKTSLTIKHATEEDDATYVCKATSEIGLATTKAKLRVTGTIFFKSIKLYTSYSRLSIKNLYVI